MRSSHFLSRGVRGADTKHRNVTALWFLIVLQFPPFYPQNASERRWIQERTRKNLRLFGFCDMAASPAPPHELATASPLLPSSCGQCLLVIVVLACLTAVFMVACLSLSFKLSVRSMQSRQSRDIVATSVPLELWAAPPTSHSQTNLLWPTEPALSPLPPLNNNREDAKFRQPRVTLHDIDEFWWRNCREV